jgi:hypothetical protein
MMERKAAIMGYRAWKIKVMVALISISFCGNEV